MRQATKVGRSGSRRRAASARTDGRGQRDVDPDGCRLPIKIDATSNGEFEPRPLARAHHVANRTALNWATENARRAGISRRKFLISNCGAATTLLAMNQVNAALGKDGGFFDITAEAALDVELANATLGGDEFIFDVQGHYVDPHGPWLRQIPSFARPFASLPQAACDGGDTDTARGYLDCLGPAAFIKDVFLDSDTDVMVLSFVPSSATAEPLTIEAAAATREVIAEMAGSKRLLLHGRVNPNQAHDLERMAVLAQQWRIAAWKTYTQFGPDGQGYYLSDDVGLAFIERARALGVKVICIHKGLPLGQRSYKHSQCQDIGVVAKQYPDVSFIVYHSGYVAGHPEGPYRAADDGVDTLIKSLLDNDIAPHSNVYAELGSTWRFLMREPQQAAHVIGKLCKYCGENNVLWGTDSIWYGSPQDQIQAFRRFQIAPALQDTHDYPALTGTLRAKIFGLNAAAPYALTAAEIARHRARDPYDRIAQAKAEYHPERRPHFTTYGPKTRREFLRLRAAQGVR